MTTYSEISTENDTKGKKEFYIKVLKPDGNEYSYKADRDFESYIGSLVEMEVDENGLINKLNRKTGGITGELDKANRKIGKYSLSRDCKIIELLKNHATGAGCTGPDIGMGITSHAQKLLNGRTGHLRAKRQRIWRYYAFVC